MANCSLPRFWLIGSFGCWLSKPCRHRSSTPPYPIDETHRSLSVATSSFAINHTVLPVALIFVVTKMADTLHFTCYKYGAHDLQRIGVWARDPSLHEAGLELAHEPAREPDSTTSSHAGREEVDDADEDIGMESSRTSSTGGQGYWVMYVLAHCLP